MNVLRKIVRILGLVFMLQIASVPVAHAVMEGKGTFKIVRLEMTVYGDLVIVADQVFTTLANCGPTNVFVLPKTPPGYATFSDVYTSRMHAMLSSAQARNASVSVTAESTFGCYWGAYPVIVVVATHN